MIVVLASIELNGGKRAEFLKEFARIVPLVRAEKGCLEYFPSVDHATHLPVQGPLRDEVVVVVEKWESVAALEAHLIAPHMMEYRPKVKDFVKKVSLQILEPMGQPFMRDIVRRLLAALETQTPLAYCRLVETRGSTPQKAGATMLVFEDGSQQGTLGGGCVEAEVKRRALGLLQEGRSEVCKFQLDSDYGWDDGLICGGRMQILVEPIAGSEESRRYFRTLSERIASSQGVTEAIVFDSAASGLNAPASYAFDAAGTCLASLHAEGSPPTTITQHLRPLLSRPRPYVQSGIAFLPVLPRCRLVIVGGGHVGKAVGDLAVQLDFDLWVVDDREEYVAEERFPKAQRRIAGNIDQILPSLEITPDTYCLIVTRGHNHDEEALFHLVNRGARYVGLIGSRRKIKMIFDDLLAEGISAESLAKVHAPLGIDIGSQTVPEIAVSICAELVAHRNLDGQVPGRPKNIEV